MSPRFASSRTSRPAPTRVVAHLLERAKAVRAERLEERRLRLHGDDVWPDGVHDPLAEPRDRGSSCGSPEHRLAAELHRKQVETRVEADDELALLPRDGLREAVGEVHRLHRRRGSRRRSRVATALRTATRICASDPGVAWERCGSASCGADLRRVETDDAQLRRRLAQEARDDEELGGVLGRE